MRTVRTVSLFVVFVLLFWGLTSSLYADWLARRQYMLSMSSSQASEVCFACLTWLYGLFVRTLISRSNVCAGCGRPTVNFIERFWPGSLRSASQVKFKVYSNKLWNEQRSYGQMYRNVLRTWCSEPWGKNLKEGAWDTDMRNVLNANSEATSPRVSRSLAAASRWLLDRLLSLGDRDCTLNCWICSIMYFHDTRGNNNRSNNNRRNLKRLQLQTSQRALNKSKGMEKWGPRYLVLV